MASNAQDVQKFILDAYQAGQSYDDVRTAVRAAGWQITDEALAALWETLRSMDDRVTPQVENTSGMQGEVPEEVEQMGWSWGAFSLALLWGFSHNVLLGKLMLALAFCEALARSAPSVEGIFAGLSLANQIYLGRYGHRLAWQNRHFVSVEQFRDTMKVWNLWGFWSFIAGLVIAIAGLVYMSASGNLKWF